MFNLKITISTKNIKNHVNLVNEEGNIEELMLI